MPPRKTEVQKAASELVDNKALVIIMDALRDDKMAEFITTPPEKLQGLQMYIKCLDDLAMKIQNSSIHMREVA